MATGVQVWSTTASQNSTADTNVNWAEGMAPSQVNDSARAVMASVAKWRDDNNGTLVTSGTTIAYTVTSNQVEAALTSGYTIAVQMHATNDSSATLNVDGLGAKPIQCIAGSNLTGGELRVGNTYRLTYSTTGTGQWINNDVTGGAALVTNSVVYGAIQQESATTLLGNPTTAVANVSEVGIGTGLVVQGTNLTAPAFPPPAVFKNLVIKVTGASSATGTADFVTMATANSSAFQTVAVNGSVSISSSVSGAAGGLDTGAPATGTAYAIWAISTAASTLAQLLASTSFTTPLLPGAYTYKARIGALLTSTTTAATALLGTWQFGRNVSYKVGLGSTLISTQYITALSSGSGPWPTAVSISQYIPPSSNVIKIIAAGNANNSNVGLSASTSVTNPAASLAGDFSLNGSNNTQINMSAAIQMTLESSNVYYGASAGGLTILVRGWEDNI